MEQPKINMPKIEPKPALKPLEMEAKLNAPQIKAAKPSIMLMDEPFGASIDGTAGGATQPWHAAFGGADRGHAGANEHS